MENLKILESFEEWLKILIKICSVSDNFRKQLKILRDFEKFQ